MALRGHGVGALLLVMLMLGAAQVPWGAVGGDRAGECRGPAPMAEEPFWTDPLDDMGHVYMTDHVDVTGGEARLAAGATEGWIASSIIEIIPGYRFDFILIEATIPGNSGVKVSALDVAKESTEVGFANETLPGCRLIEGTFLSIYSVETGAYPKVRIQVNLLADGADKPALVRWSLYFSLVDEWHDDFISPDKILGSRGINITNGVVELNQSSDIGEFQDYDPFPPVFISQWELNHPDTIEALYPNDERTGYQDPEYLTCEDTTGLYFDDLDGDWNIDLVCSNFASPVSQIYWGNGTERWSSNHATDLTTDHAWDAVTGDFNGDGLNDLAFTGYQNAFSCPIFLNNGEKKFNTTPDIILTGPPLSTRLAAGDLNSDGFDDIVFQTSSLKAPCFFGGPNGPDTTADIEFTMGTGAPNGIGGVLARDLDGDGHLDVVFSTTHSRKIPIYLGGAKGPDTTADYLLTVSGDICDCIGAGDVNGDGYIDIACTIKKDSDHDTLYVFEGSKDGWDDTSPFNTTIEGDSCGLQIIDVDLDGFVDILLATGWLSDSKYFYYFSGGTSLSTTPKMKISTTSDCRDLEVPVGKQQRNPGTRGNFFTQAITRPEGTKWDILCIEGRMPKNTSILMSILDVNKKQISGYIDTSNWDIDISGIIDRTIYVVVRILSDNNMTTPTIDRLMVNWMDEMTWREQFFGLMKIERHLGLAIDAKALGRPVESRFTKELLFSSLRGDDGFQSNSTCFSDDGGLDYSTPPLTFNTNGASSVDVADVDGNGFGDAVFAIYQDDMNHFNVKSPLFLNSHVGWGPQADHVFETTGATDVLVEDLNGDGFYDVVFAQEYDGTTYRIDSVLFWGSDSGYNSTPDVRFTTNGASGVIAADLDDDDDLDLAFACYRDDTTTLSDSMVFLQGTMGFCGTVPSDRLPTMGARAVSAGDINNDGRMDIVFANSLSEVSVEIDSYIYWGKIGGGFETLPKGLSTVGAADVKVNDLDGDADLDVVFANQRDDLPEYRVDSYVYLNDGAGNFPFTPSIRFPTTGAIAVAVADLDLTGYKDLIFACQYDGTTYNVPSVAYLGDNSGSYKTPAIVLPTTGASDVLITHLFNTGDGGYLSKAITPKNPSETSAFHTFRYTASLGQEQSGKMQLIDATTWDILAETPLQSGTHMWLVRDTFNFREHQSIRVAAIVTGLDKPGEFKLDDLWLNWTKRVRLPPQVLGLEVRPSTLLRLDRGEVVVDVMDEYDPPSTIVPFIEHRLSGSTGPWSVSMLGQMSYSSTEGAWRTLVLPNADMAIGTYDFRVVVMDSDMLTSEYVLFPHILEVRNNLPTIPVVRVTPQSPSTMDTLRVEIVTPATDRETLVTYHYRWYTDGTLVNILATETVPPVLTTHGQNWSVEVRAFDGIDESPPAIAWVVIANSPPTVKQTLPNPELQEDTVDDMWLDLSEAFMEIDGDALVYTVGVAPEHIQLAIDPSGRVTIRPAANWNGQESATFVASDGELSVSQTVLITVTPVNDLPRFMTVNGMPITEDPVTLEVDQGQLLTITVGVEEVDGDELAFEANSTAVEVDGQTGTITLRPGNDDVGTWRFVLLMYDVYYPGTKVSLNFTVLVRDVNDPPGTPAITSPKAGAKFKANATFTLTGTCADPDSIHGQVLNYTWWWNGTNLIGHGPSITTKFLSPGTYIITLNVTDGELDKSTSVEIVVEPGDIPPPPPPPPDGEDGGGIGTTAVIGMLVVLLFIVVLLSLVVKRKRGKVSEVAAPEERKT